MSQAEKLIEQVVNEGRGLPFAQIERVAKSVDPRAFVTGPGPMPMGDKRNYAKEGSFVDANFNYTRKTKEQAHNAAVEFVRAITSAGGVIPDMKDYGSGRGVFSWDSTVYTVTVLCNDRLPSNYNPA